MKLSDLNIKPNIKQGKCRCPECDDTRSDKRDTSLSVNLDNGLYFCHYCGAAGILDEYKTNIKTELDENYTPPKLNTTGLGEAQQTYLVDRGIKISVANRNRITQSLKGWIAFNYFEGDELVNVKYRNIKDKRFYQSPGGKPIFYGINDIIGQKDIIICEGEIDKLSIEVAGFTNCISVPLGAPNEGDKSADSKLKCIELAQEYFSELESVTIAVDNDRNGKRLREELARRFGKDRCKWVDFGEYKDANDVLQDAGASTLQAMIYGAIEFPIEGVTRVGDHIQAVHDLYIIGGPESFDVGLGPDFNILYRVVPGFLSIITGAPTSGKSNFIENIIMNMMKIHNWPIAAYTPEHPEELEIQRLARMYVGKYFFDGQNERMSTEELAGAVKFLHERFYFIKHKLNNTIERIIETLKQCVMKYGIKGAMIDPWTDVDHELKGTNETMYVGRSLAMLKDFCRTYDVHVWLIAHPSKPRKDKNGDFIKPTMYDISGSANFYNKADMGIIVHREESIVKVDIKKVKFEGLHGKKGVACFSYDYPSCTYTPTNDTETDVRF